MAKFLMMMMSMVFGVVLLECAAAQTVHVVGGNMGWTVPSTGAGAYDTWAAGQQFVVGDILTFNFTTGEHDVQQVPKASYDACTASNPIGSLITVGPANITLDSAGEHHYICTVGRHCQLGQKLTISVSASPGGSPSPTSPPTSPTSPTTPTTPTTPAPNSGTPEDCPPGPASSPTSPGGSNNPSGPSGSTTPPSSSSPSVLAGVLVPMMAVVVGFFF